MTPMLLLATRAFEKLQQLRMAALRTKPPPAAINIIGAPQQTTIKGAQLTTYNTNSNQGEYDMKSQPFKIGQIYRDVLQDGETRRTPVMLKDATRFCDLCEGTGKIKDASIRCALCGGSGFLNANGQGIDVANNTEGARGGEFGTDRSSLSDADRRVHDYMEHLAKSAPHRAGFRIDSSPEGRAARQKTFDAITEMEAERAQAWRNLDAGYVASPDGEKNVGAGNPGRNFGKAPQEGDACTINGRKGTIKNGECVASNEDSRTVTQVAADHAQNMENVYQEHSNYLQNAWRNLR
jgi:hypothetical protein